jgi:hypothetical protein
MSVGAGKVSRYVPYLTPAFLALYYWILLQHKNKKRQLGIYALVALSLIGAFRVHPVDLQTATMFKQGKDQWADCYKSIKDIEKCTEITQFQIHPHPHEVQLKDKLDYLEQHHLNLFAD